jgi:hypothetical protein
MEELSLGELVAVLTLGQDSSFGQPLESQMRSTLLAIWLAGSAGLDTEVRDTAYWCAQLRYLGCTAHAHEVSAMFGDDIATRARTLTYDASSQAEVLRDAVTFGLPAMRGVARVGAIAAILAGGRKFAQMNFRSGLTTAQIAQRLVISPKTADSHIQHIYAKIGCSTRAAAVLFALRHDLVG